MRRDVRAMYWARKPLKQSWSVLHEWDCSQAASQIVPFENQRVWREVRNPSTRVFHFISFVWNQGPENQGREGGDHVVEKGGAKEELAVVVTPFGDIDHRTIIRSKAIKHPKIDINKSYSQSLLASPKWISEDGVKWRGLGGDLPTASIQL